MGHQFSTIVVVVVFADVGGDAGDVGGGGVFVFPAITRSSIKFMALNVGINFGRDVALWFRTAMNRDVGTGSLARPFAHSLALLYHLLHPTCFV